MKDKIVTIIQQIERQTQMQYCGVDYLEGGHSIYAAYDVNEDNDGLCFHGAYSGDVSDEIGNFNGSPIEDVAKHLCETGKLSQRKLKTLLSGLWSQCPKPNAT